MENSTQVLGGYKKESTQMQTCSVSTKSTASNSLIKKSLKQRQDICAKVNVIYKKKVFQHC